MYLKWTPYLKNEISRVYANSCMRVISWKNSSLTWRREYVRARVTSSLSVCAQVSFACVRKTCFSVVCIYVHCSPQPLSFESVISHTFMFILHTFIHVRSKSQRYMCASRMKVCSRCRPTDLCPAIFRVRGSFTLNSCRPLDLPNGKERRCIWKIPWPERRFFLRRRSLYLTKRAVDTLLAHYSPENV